jgi:hypothetical protein
MVLVGMDWRKGGGKVRLAVQFRAFVLPADAETGLGNRHDAKVPGAVGLPSNRCPFLALTQSSAGHA